MEKGRVNQVAQLRAGNAQSGDVLVLGNDARMALPIIRSLGRRQLNVHFGWYAPDNLATRSKYISATHSLPLYSDRQLDWRRELSHLLASTAFDLVIPASEEAFFALQTHRGALGDRAPIYLLDEDAFAVTQDKRKTYELAESLDIPIPETISDVEVAKPKSVYVVKPWSSVSIDGPHVKHFVRKFRQRAELESYLTHLRSHGTGALVQELVSGRGVGVNVLANQGKVLVAFQHVRLHETTGFGSTYRMSVALDPQLYAAASRMIEALNYTGVAMIEFRADPDTGSWVLLEINGRFWGSLPLAVAAGADFPKFLYEMLVEGKRSFPQSYRVGIRCRNLSSDARWLMLSLRGRHRGNAPLNEAHYGWELNPLSNRQIVLDTLRGLSLRDYSDTFAPDDPKPWFAEVKQLCEDTYRAVARRARRPSD